MNDQELNSKDGSEIENAFFSDGYQLARAYVGPVITVKSLYKGIKQLYASLDDFLVLFLEAAARGGDPSECSKGCSWCCYQTVYAQSHELEYLRRWMQMYLVKEEIDNTMQKAQEKNLHTSGMNKIELALFKRPCPFLRDGVCIAYAARPLACRIYNSYKASSCQYEKEHPEDQDSYPKLYEFPFKAGRKMNEGFTQWLTEQGQLIEEFTLEKGIVRSLEH